MSDLERYEAFVAIVESGSLTAAAQRCGRSVQAISRALGSLEQDLAVSLIQRTTRRSTLTEQGRLLYAGLRSALAEIEATREALISKQQRLEGSIRLSASALFGQHFIAPAVAAFLVANPGVTTHLRLSDEFVELPSDEIDLAIRIGRLADSSLKCRVLGHVARACFASPAYLAARGEPLDPDDLNAHDCVIRADKGVNRWEFNHNGPYLVPIRGRFTTNCASACIEAVVQGAGIGYAGLWQIKSLLEQRRVVRVLSEFEPTPVPVYALMPAGNQPLRVSALVDYIEAHVPWANFQI